MKNIIQQLSRKSAILLAVFVLALTACNNRLVFDEEGDCVVNYRLRFVYNKNLKWADAFPSEVHSVHLYAFDRHGLFVKDFVANGDAVDREDYRMQLELDPGRYTLVAWCGMDNEGVTQKTFTVPEPVAGQTRIEELTCTLNVNPDSLPVQCSDKMLNFLYHGMLTVDLPNVYNGDFDYTMELTKNTNHIRIILHQLSSEDMDPKEFEFKIEDANGVLNYNNKLLGTELITYRPWDLQTGEAGVVPPGETESRAIVYAKGLVADFSMSRLMADHQNDLKLTVTSKGKEIIKMPILHYTLNSREYYKLAYGHDMTEQELLDREDEYEYIFFLDDSQRWTEMQINILSWKIVEYNYEM